MGDLLSVIYYPQATQMSGCDRCRAAPYWNASSIQSQLASYLRIYRQVSEAGTVGDLEAVTEDLAGAFCGRWCPSRPNARKQFAQVWHRPRWPPD